nr:uncharacterized protein LOC127339957 [Lolium perenne]
MSPTPNSVAKTKRPIGRKAAKEKAKKGGDDDIKASLSAIMLARKEMADDRKMLKKQEIDELRVAEERKAAAEERMAAVEELKAQVENKKVTMEELRREQEREDKLMFMDNNGMSEKQKQYIEMCRDQLMAKKQMGSYMATFGGAMAGGAAVGIGGGMPGSYGGGIGGGMAMSYGGGMPTMGAYMAVSYGGGMGGDIGRGMPTMGSYMGGYGGGMAGGMGNYMSGIFGGSTDGAMAGGMSGGISSNTTNVDEDGGNGDNKGMTSGDGMIGGEGMGGNDDTTIINEP